jgi:hypothetical protein
MEGLTHSWRQWIGPAKSPEVSAITRWFIEKSAG